jgi:hypothetical protein
MAMSREERVALHTNQKRMQFSSEMPNEKSLVEGKPEYRETSKGLYQYVRFNNEVYSQLFTRHTRTLEEQINDTVNNITVNEVSISGTLDVSSGGTGLATITDGAVMLGSGTGDVTPLAVTTNGAILIGDGTTDPTTYNAFSSSTGTLNVSAGGTGAASLTSNAVLTGNSTSAITAEGNLSFNGSTLAVTGALSNTTAADLSTSSGITTIGSSNALTVSAAGVLTVNNATDSTSSTSGSVIIDGGVGIAKILFVGTDVWIGDDLIVGDDVSLTGDGSIFRMGDGGDFSITHDGGTGATVTSSGALVVDSTASTLTLDGHSGVTIQNGTVSADIVLDSGADIVLDAAGGNFEFKDGGVAQLTIDVDTTAGDIILNLEVNGDDLVFTQFDNNEVLRLKDEELIVIRNSYITDHAINSKPTSNGRHFATGDADYQQNYSWIGLYDQQAATTEHDADFGTW